MTQTAAMTALAQLSIMVTTPIFCDEVLSLGICHSGDPITPTALGTPVWWLQPQCRPNCSVWPTEKSAHRALQGSEAPLNLKHGVQNLCWEGFYKSPPYLPVRKQQWWLIIPLFLWARNSDRTQQRQLISVVWVLCWRLKCWEAGIIWRLNGN